MRSLRWGALACALAACGAEPTPYEGRCPTWYRDLDGDGFGDGAAGGVEQCEPPERGYVGNPYDCDDLDPEVHPLAVETCDPLDVDENCDGLADNEDPEALNRAVEAWPDADRDGHAGTEVAYICDLADGWMPERGRDCDDADPSVHPHAPDPLDGVDTNCDRLDGPAIFEDFEAGGPDPEVWLELTQVEAQTSWVPEGLVAAALAPGAIATSVAIDTSVCEAVAWHYQAMAHDADLASTPLRLEYHDGAAWRLLDAWPSLGHSRWHRRWGVIEDAAARHPALRVRLVGTHGRSSYYLDELLVGCAVESDDDGIPDGVDCASTDPLHWFDCGECVDADGDGVGLGCDLGPDCDDADPAAHPGAADPPGDGVDADCTGLDGAALLDAFDDGPEGVMWHPLVNAGVEPLYPHSPPYALRVGDQGEAVSPPLDLSACDDGVWWEYRVRPAGGFQYDTLTFSYEGPDGWVEADARDSRTFYLPDYEWRRGVVDAPEAARAGARFRFAAPLLRWAIDDVSVGCFVDPDGDAVPDFRDCAPDDPEHWFDCGLCVDADGDDHGADCDLGGDCDEARTDVHEGAVDADVDAVDQDCDGLDGPRILDDEFHPDGLSPALWAQSEGVDVWRHVASGNAGVNFYEVGVLEAAPVDATACARLGWRIRGRASVPQVGQRLAVDYWDGAAWIELGAWQPPASSSDWYEHVGSTVEAGPVRPDLRIRLRGVSPQWEYVAVDAFALGCAP